MPVNVQAKGAMGNDSNDDLAAIQAAVDATPAGGEVYVPHGIYRISGQINIDKPLKLECAPGAVLKLSKVISGINKHIDIHSLLGTKHTFGNIAITSGQTRIALHDATGLTVGQTVWLGMGQNYPYDHEWYSSMFNRIAGISGNTVVLDTPIAEDIPAPHDNVNTLYELRSIAENVELSGCSFDLLAGLSGLPDGTVTVEHARNVHVHNLHGIHIAGAMPGIIYSENVLIENIRAEWSEKVNGYPDGGRLVAGWGDRNVTLHNIWCGNCENNFIGMEAQTRSMVVDHAYMASSSTDPQHSPTIAIGLAGHTVGVDLRNIIVNSPTANVINAQDDSSYTIRNVTITNGAHIAAFCLAGQEGSIDINNARYLTYMTATYTVPIAANANWASFPAPQGLYRNMQLYMSPGTSGIKFLMLMSGGNHGIDISSAPHPGITTEVTSQISCIGQNYPWNVPRDNSKVFVYSSDAAVRPNSYATITIEYYPEPAYPFTPPQGFTGIKTMGSCTVTLIGGIITDVTGC
jgi:hypothetical protein